MLAGVCISFHLERLENKKPCSRPGSRMNPETDPPNSLNTPKVSLFQENRGPPDLRNLLGEEGSEEASPGFGCLG